MLKNQNYISGRLLRSTCAARLLLITVVIGAVTLCIGNVSIDEEKYEKHQHEPQHDQSEQISSISAEPVAHGPIKDPTPYFETNSIELLDNKMQLGDYLANLLHSIKLVVAFDNDLHRYDHPEGALRSSTASWTHQQLLASVNLTGSEDIDLPMPSHQQECGYQLDELIKGTNNIYQSIKWDEQGAYLKSRQLSLANWLDSFGGPTAGLMQGNNLWLGSASQCESASIGLSDQRDLRVIRGRYCLARFQSPINTDSGLKHLVKVGICLPQACDSLSLRYHEHKIELLTKRARQQHTRATPFSQFKLAGLFCLPDEDSPMRQATLTVKLFIGFIALWAAVVFWHSIRFEFSRMRSRDPCKRTRLQQVFALRIAWWRLFDSEPAGCVTSASSLDDHYQQQHQMNTQKFSNQITNQLVSSTKQSADPVTAIQPARTQLETTTTTKVHLTSVDGIKVISMIWLIAVHSLMFFIRVISNPNQFWNFQRDFRFITVIAGVFPVDSFFTITGLLTGYLTIVRQPKNPSPTAQFWLETLFARYFRFMPMYLIVFLYSRDISELTGRGPLWDYATANSSLRALCKQESVLVPLTFQANLKPIQEHCVRPAYYLANDFQYLLLTPILLQFINSNNSRRNRLFVAALIGLSLLAQFFTVFSAPQLLDPEVFINFKPMFATYLLIDLWSLYVLPHNRFPPYLIGLFTGILLSQFQSRKNCSQDQRNRESPGQKRQSVCSKIQTSDEFTKVHKSTSIANYIALELWWPILVLLTIVYIPLGAGIFKLTGLAAKIGTSSVVALMRLLWSLAIARIVYLCATKSYLNGPDGSFVGRLLSNQLWRPWAKICLSALLVQWEVIMYFAQTQTSPPDMTVQFLAATILLCVVTTYVVALVIYLTIEYPMAQLELLYLRPIFFAKRKKEVQ